MAEAQVAPLRPKHGTPGLAGSDGRARFGGAEAGQTEQVTFTPEVQPTSANDTVAVSLPSEDVAAGQARQVVRDTLTRWRLPLLIDSCVLAVSELVTNAVRHGRPPIGMLLRRRPLELRLDVRDSDPRTGSHPDRGDATDPLESGRGLNIVQAIADVSGSEHIPGDGKTVFAYWHIGR